MSTNPTLKTPFSESQMAEIETLITNGLAAKLAAGVYLIKVDGEIIRYDTISDTPIQDAINAAEVNVVAKDSVLLVNYECGPASLGFNGKMEQNIILRDDVNMYALGGTKIYSNSTDDVPIFTDNGVFCQVFFIGYWNMVRYGGSGNNNRAAVKLTNGTSEIYFPDFVVADTSSGSNYSFISAGSINIGNGFWTRGLSISGGNSIITCDPHYAPNTVITGGTLRYYGRIGSLTQSGGTLYLNEGNITQNALLSNGTSYIRNCTLLDINVSGSAVVSISNCVIGAPDNGVINQVTVTGGTCRIDDCQIFGSDTDADQGIGVSCTSGTVICSYTTIVMSDIYSNGVLSLSQSGGGVIKNYFSISNTATSGTIGVGALTVNAGVE